MASVWKKGPSWWVKYRDGRGVYQQVRTTAPTKTEARRLALELERTAERQRLGLEPLPSSSNGTLGELVEWWLENRCSDASRKIETSRLKTNVVQRPIGRVPMAQLRGSDVEDLLRTMEAEGGAAESVEHVRRKLRAIINAAKGAKGPLRFVGPNPITDGEDAPKPRKIPKRSYKLLGADEVEPVLLACEPRWRAAMATAIYTGIRPGELMALRKEDVDLEAGLLLVTRSWERDRPKDGDAEVLPIAKPLRPYLQAAIAASPSAWVFPRPDGKPHSRDVDLVKVLRRAIAAAGFLEGWDHVCRRCKAGGVEGHTTRHPDDGERRCERCNMRLWPRAIPRPVRWYDLRHTTATLLLRDGVSLALVSRLLRHSDPKITMQRYGHLVAEDLRGALERLPVVEHRKDEAAEAGDEEVSPRATRLLPSPLSKGEAPNPPRKTGVKSGPYWRAMRDSNPRPLASKANALSSCANRP